MAPSFQDLSDLPRDQLSSDVFDIRMDDYNIQLTIWILKPRIEAELDLGKHQHICFLHLYNVIDSRLRKETNQLTQNKNTRWRKRPILSFSENKRMLCNARLVATHLWLGKFPFSERGFLEKGFDLAAIKQITVCFNSQRIFNKVHWKQ